MFPRRQTARQSPVFFTAERPVCVPYKRKGQCTTPDRLKPKKVGSKSARRERVYKRAAETPRDFFRRGGARQAGGCHALPRGTELSSLCDDEVCVPYKRKSECTKLYRLIPKKVGSKSARRERVYKQAAETPRDFFRRGGARQAGGCHALPRGTELSDLCDDEVCVPYKRESECTKLYRLIPKKVGSKSARRERVYKRAAKTQRDFFRRGGARQAGGCHALPRGTELSDLCSDELQSVTAKFTD